MRLITATETVHIEIVSIEDNKEAWYFFRELEVEEGQKHVNLELKITSEQRIREMKHNNYLHFTA